MQCYYDSFSVDYKLGRLTWKYIDRMTDPTDVDDTEKILKEFVGEWKKIAEEGFNVV